MVVVKFQYQEYRMNRILLAFVLLLSFHAVGQTQLPDLDSLDSGWNTIATDGLCSSGTPYQFYVKPGGGRDGLLVFFNGGGGCWFGQACDLTSEPNIHTPFDDLDQNNPALGGGIFDFTRTGNPFAQFDMVVLPYCTGDVHIGGGPREYNYKNAEGADVVVMVYHNGMQNSSTVLDWVYANYAAPSRIVVSGSSAGAIGASLHGGLLAEHYASIPITLIADAAGAYGSPFLSTVHNAWNTAAGLPDWKEYEGETNDSISFEDFYIASASHNPNLTIAQYNTASDAVQQTFTRLMGDPAGSFSLPQRLLTNYQEIERGGERC